MKKLVFILFLLTHLINQSIAQTVDSRVLVRNAGVINGKQTISVKWYDKELYYPEGVNVYRKEGKGEWKKLNASPIKKLEDVSAAEYAKDKELDFFVPLINKGKKDQIPPFIFINVIVKTFESEIFSKFLGIQYEDSTVKAGQSYSYKINKIKGNSEYLIGESLSLTAGAESIEEPVKEITMKADTSKVLMKWRTEQQRFYAVNIYKEEINNWKKLNPIPVMISSFKDSLGRTQYPKVYFMDDSLKVKATEFIGYGTIPIGGIIMWAGNPATIPAGWALCNGTNGTPDLSGRFIVG